MVEKIPNDSKILKITPAEMTSIRWRTDLFWSKSGSSNSRITLPSSSTYKIAIKSIVIFISIDSPEPRHSLGTQRNLQVEMHEVQIRYYLCR